MQPLDPKIPISVLMTAYNTGAFIGDAIKSILEQTFADFEFIIVNDGSTDHTEEVITGFADKRIRLLNNETNLGIVASANRGLELCSGKYICRMDSDDLCHRDRFRRQYRFMERHPHCIVSGTHYRKIKGEQTTSSSKHFFHVRDKEIRVEMLRNSPIANNSIIIRRELFVEHGVRYDPDFQYCEDYAFWYEAMRHGEVHKLNRPLVYYRQHGDQVTRKYADLQLHNANRIRQALISDLVPNILPDELTTHLALMTDLNPRCGIRAQDVTDWVDKVCRINRERGFYDAKLFTRLMNRRKNRFLQTL